MNKITCVICNIQAAKYKCSKCRINYCSVTCYKHHKNSECNLVKDAPVLNESTARRYRFPTEDTVPPEKLSMLGESKALIDILKDCNLRDLLKKVDTSPDASRAIQMAMQDQNFVHFVNECLRIVEPNM